MTSDDFAKNFYIEKLNFSRQPLYIIDNYFVHLQPENLI